MLYPVSIFYCSKGEKNAFRLHHPFGAIRSVVSSQAEACRQTSAISLRVPVRNLVVRLFDNCSLDLRTGSLLLQAIASDLQTAIGILLGTKGSHFAGVHVAELSMGVDEIRAPRHGMGAELSGVMGGDRGDDQLVRHPLWAWTGRGSLLC